MKKPRRQKSPEQVHPSGERQHHEEHRRLLLDAYYGVLNTVPEFLRSLQSLSDMLPDELPPFDRPEALALAARVLRVDPHANKG